MVINFFLMISIIIVKRQFSVSDVVPLNHFFTILLQQHYTIRELSVLAECVCNGLAVNCTRSNVSNNYECLCGYNSQGVLCESCLPLYNQQSYQPGVPCEGSYYLNIMLALRYKQN